METGDKDEVQSYSRDESYNSDAVQWDLHVEIP